MKDRRTKSLFRDERAKHPRYEGDCACALPVGFIFNFKLNPPLIKFCYLLTILRHKGVSQELSAVIFHVRAPFVYDRVFHRGLLLLHYWGFPRCGSSLLLQRRFYFYVQEIMYGSIGMSDVSFGYDAHS